MSFFKAPQAAAILKHGILKRYLPVFAAKTGSTAGEVVYVDGYAGPGLYDDGSPGSPTLALDTAATLASYRGKATLNGHLIEQDADSVARLRDLLSGYQATWSVHHGRVEGQLPSIMSAMSGDTPLFAFIDPFGLPIPFDMVQEILARGGRATRYGRVGGAATEILLNFSIPGINRVGGQLTGSGSDPTWLKARDTMVSRMDEVLGGDWWQRIWRQDDDDRVEQILEGYKDRLLAGTKGGGWAVFDVDVSDRWKGPPSYHLLLFTQHRDGIWAFHENLSLAMEEYREFCHEHEGLLDLEPLKDREAAWKAHIDANLREILLEGKKFRPVDKIMRLYGDAFGEARTKHLRPALKRAFQDGLTSTNCVGVSDLGPLEIKPPK